MKELVISVLCGLATILVVLPAVNTAASNREALIIEQSKVLASDITGYVVVYISPQDDLSKTLNDFDGKGFEFISFSGTTGYYIFYKQKEQPDGSPAKICTKHPR